MIQTGNSRLHMLTYLCQSVSIIITLSEYEFQGRNDDLVSRYHSWYNLAIREIKLTPDQVISSIIQFIDTFSNVKVSREKILYGTKNLPDIESIFGSYITDRITSRIITFENSSFTVFVNNVLLGDDSGVFLRYHYNREAFSFICESSLLLLCRIRDHRFKTVKDSLRFLNGLSLNPSLDLF